MTDEDFGVICICAVRYAIGRMTYMPGLVQDFIKRNIANISTRDIGTMISDLLGTTFFGDDVIDKPDWIAFRKFLKAEKEKRGNNSND